MVREREGAEGEEMWGQRPNKGANARSSGGAPVAMATTQLKGGRVNPQSALSLLCKRETLSSSSAHLYILSLSFPYFITRCGGGESPRKGKRYESNKREAARYYRLCEVESSVGYALSGADSPLSSLGNREQV